MYARLKVQDQGSDTWVCTRLQPEGGSELAGGKFVVADASSAVDQDSNYGGCTSRSDADGDNIVPPPHPIRSGNVGDPNDPPSVPYMVDAYANGDGEAWLCLQASLGARVMFNGAGAAFHQDDSAQAVSPPRTPWTPGKASTDCETQAGGTLTKLINAEIDGTQVWLDAWQSGPITQLCVRAEGADEAGGRLRVDTTPSVGVTPVLQQAPDDDGCSTNIFSSNEDELYITRSPGTGQPVSICIKKGTTEQRFTIGYTGTPGVNQPTWTADED